MKLIEEDCSSVSKDCFAHLVSDSDLKDAQNGATSKKTLTRTLNTNWDATIWKEWGAYRQKTCPSTSSECPF